MAISEKQRQKKLQQKRQKRQQAMQAARRSSVVPRKASQFAHLPIHECLIPANLFDVGIGSLIWARRAGVGQLAVSAFVLDVFCLGVKNAMFRGLDERTYEEEMKPSLTIAAEGAAFQAVHPTCLRKLIEGAVDYASDLGFQPHRDYREAKGIFGDVDAMACPTRFEYGQDGKPFYIRGPKESIAQAKRIVAQLEKRCGQDNCHYLVEMDDPRNAG